MGGPVYARERLWVCFLCFLCPSFLRVCCPADPLTRRHGAGLALTRRLLGESAESQQAAADTCWCARPLISGQSFVSFIASPLLSFKSLKMQHKSRAFLPSVSQSQRRPGTARRGEEPPISRARKARLDEAEHRRKLRVGGLLAVEGKD